MAERVDYGISTWEILSHGTRASFVGDLTVHEDWSISIVSVGDRAKLLAYYQTWDGFIDQNAVLSTKEED